MEQPQPKAQTADNLATLLAPQISRWREGQTLPLVVGLCGPQGSGKSTAAAGIVTLLAGAGYASAVLSLDDLVVSRARRRQLAHSVHPLLATRGPPGTHDVGLGMAVLDDLRAGRPVRLPRFDKGRDEPSPHPDWPVVERPCDVILFEGWCVGADAQPENLLAEPVNALERDEDPDGIWRGYVNKALAEDYQELFGRIDRLVLLCAPSFATVFNWRKQQEAPLIRVNAPAAMDDAALARFIQHFERITTYCGSEMAKRADIVVKLNDARNIIAWQQAACG